MPDNPRRLDFVQSVLGLRASIPAVSSAHESDPAILKMALDVWSHDLVGPEAAS
jgi:hypothetical protein